jgi:hypothetical protein
MKSKFAVQMQLANSPGIGQSVNFGKPWPKDRIALMLWGFFLRFIV